MLPSRPQFQHLYAGLTVLADWIGSDNRLCQYPVPCKADYAARSLVAQLRVLERAEPFGLDLYFPDSDEHILTRIGEEGPLLRLDTAPLGPSGVMR